MHLSKHDYVKRASHNLSLCRLLCIVHLAEVFWFLGRSLTITIQWYLFLFLVCCRRNKWQWVWTCVKKRGSLRGIRSQHCGFSDRHAICYCRSSRWLWKWVLYYLNKYLEAVDRHLVMHFIFTSFWWLAMLLSANSYLVLCCQNCHGLYEEMAPNILGQVILWLLLKAMGLADHFMVYNDPLYFFRNKAILQFQKYLPIHVING